MESVFRGWASSEPLSVSLVAHVRVPVCARPGRSRKVTAGWSYLRLKYETCTSCQGTSLCARCYLQKTGSRKSRGHAVTALKPVSHAVTGGPVYKGGACVSKPWPLSPRLGLVCLTYCMLRLPLGCATGRANLTQISRAFAYLGWVGIPSGSNAASPDSRLPQHWQRCPFRACCAGAQKHLSTADNGGHHCLLAATCFRLCSQLMHSESSRRPSAAAG